MTVIDDRQGAEVLRDREQIRSFVWKWSEQLDTATLDLAHLLRAVPPERVEAALSTSEQVELDQIETALGLVLGMLSYLAGRLGAEGTRKEATSEHQGS